VGEVEGWGDSGGGVGIDRKFGLMFVFLELSRAACFTFNVGNGQLLFERVRGRGEGGWREGGVLACRFG